MVNELKMAEKDAILGLLAMGWSHRRIARELGVNRETVSRYAKIQQSSALPTPPPPESEAGLLSNPTISTPGSEAGLPSNPAISTPGSSPPTQQSGRQSHCAFFDEIVRKKISQNLSAQRIYQDIVADHGFSGSYCSVKRYVRKIREKSPLPVRRMEVDPGTEAQVDYGEGWWLLENGKRRKAHVLRLVLSHSRKGYSEAVPRQSTLAFLRILENAFHALGGVPATLVPDNTSSAVKKADWYDPVLHPIVQDFCRHYGTVMLPTRPYHPEHKGKIERGIGYVKGNALKGRIFESLSALNAFLREWEKNIADTRIHGTTRAHVGELYRTVERATLRPLPSDRFPIYEEGRRKVHRDGHIDIRHAYYSVPPEYLGCEVWVRWTEKIVRIFNDNLKEIALHPRVPLGKFHTADAHIPVQKRSGVEKGVPDLMRRASRIGENAELWAKALLEERKIEGIRVLQGFLNLARKTTAAQLDLAAKKALVAHQFRLQFLRDLIARKIVPDPPPLTTTHPQIRPLSEYQTLVENAPIDPDPDDDIFLKED